MKKITRDTKDLENILAYRNAIFDAANYSIIATDLKGVITDLNKKAEIILGYSADELIGKHTPAIIHDPLEVSQRAAELSQELGRSIAPGFDVFIEKTKINQIEEREWTYIRKDGSRLTVLLSVTGIRNQVGMLIGFLGVANDISAQKAVEQSLHSASKSLFRANKLHRDVLDSLFMPAFLLDADHRVIAWNRACTELTGVASDAVLGTKDAWRGFYTRPQPILADFLINGSLLGLEDIAAEFKDFKIYERGLEAQRWFDTINGRKRYLIFNVVPLWDENENLVAVIQTANDMTDIKTAEERYAKLAAIVESSDDAIISKDLNGVVTSWNHGASKTFGYQAEDAIGQRINTLFSGDRESIIDKIKQGEAIKHYETLHVTDDGPVYLSATLSPIIDSEGQIKGISEVIRDITFQKSAHQALKDREQRLNAIHNTVADGIITITLDGIMESFNPAAERIFGYDQAEVVGRNVSCLMPEPFSSEHDQYLQRFATSGRSTVLGVIREMIGLRKDGTTFPLELAIGDMKVGNVRMITGVVRDITERKQAEKTISDARIAAEKANEAKSMFIANMSHEIRTPMNAVLGLLTILAESRLDDLQKLYVDKILSASKGLMHILNDILDFSKLQANAVELEFVSFRLDDLMQDIMDLFSVAASEKQIALILDAPQFSGLCCKGDIHRLSQVLKNLISNALKFTEKGQVSISVSAMSPAFFQHTSRQIIRFDISDTGIGLTTEQIEYVFNTFGQADISTTRRFGGSGLGLSICKQLIELMGGTIGLHSVPGEGTTVWFTVPLEFDSNAPAVEQHYHSLYNEHLLIIDDDNFARDLVGHQLSYWNVRFDSVAGSDEALQCIRNADRRDDPFTILLIDWLMPERDGIWLLERIHADLVSGRLKYRPYVLMMSGANRQSLIQSALNGELAPDAFLTKPFTASRLFDCLTEMKRKPYSPGTKALQSIDRFHPAIAGARVLLVEDNETNQLVALTMLEKIGCRINVASNGLEALELLRAAVSQEKPYELVFMDLHMPVMDGFEATALIRSSEWGRDLPVVAMTAAAFASDRKAVKDAGMQDFVTKPIDMQHLTEVLLRWLPRCMAVEEASSSSDPAEQFAETNATLDDLKGFDLSAVRMRLDHDEDLICLMLCQYAKDFSTWEHDFNEAHRQGDNAKLAKLLHTLKGAAANVGATRVCESAQALEVDIARGNDAIQPLIDACIMALRDSLGQLSDKFLTKS